MTQLLNDPGNISNQLDRLISELGIPGAAFTNLDAVTTHDSTGLILVQELKHGNEKVSAGQWRTLRLLSKLPGVTVWVVRFWDADIITVQVVPQSEGAVMSPVQYQALFTAWWNGPTPPA